MTTTEGLNIEDTNQVNPIEKLLKDHEHIEGIQNNDSHTQALIKIDIKQSKTSSNDINQRITNSRIDSKNKKDYIRKYEFVKEGDSFVIKEVNNTNNLENPIPDLFTPYIFTLL
jgi:hypothetical protein